MQVLQERVAGLDVHKDTVVACVLLGPPSGPTEKHTRTFGTTTGALLSMRDWLEEHKVQGVVMEATGVYWCPVFNVLQHDAPETEGAEGMRLILSNPQQERRTQGLIKALEALGHKVSLASASVTDEATPNPEGCGSLCVAASATVTSAGKTLADRGTRAPG
jgi:hypothetical protein